MTKVSVSLLFTFFSLVLSARAAWASETIDLVIIEIQSGNYLGEDDIVRFKDDYGR